MQAYPLDWPLGWSRSKRPQPSRFDCTLAKARDGLLRELELMGARHPVLSTNVALRRDGLPYANQPEPDDKGVAIYFEYKGNGMVFACDQWDHVRDNIQAVRRTIEALRGIERWGASDMMERAFSGFKALPDYSSQSDWHTVLEVDAGASRDEAYAAYRQKVKVAHPDQGGSIEEFLHINRAWDSAKRSFQPAH